MKVGGMFHVFSFFLRFLNKLQEHMFSIHCNRADAYCKERMATSYDLMPKHR